MNASTIIARPSLQVLADMLAVATGDPHGTADLRACAWTSLLHLRRQHGSLAEARRHAALRMGYVPRAGGGRAS